MFLRRVIGQEMAHREGKVFPEAPPVILGPMLTGQPQDQSSGWRRGHRETAAGHCEGKGVGRCVCASTRELMLEDVDPCGWQKGAPCPSRGVVVAAL